jgi:predicted MFS family arabinose efflux permease
MNASFNNFVHDVFSLSASERGNLEFPRELPGFLLIFITSLLASYSLRTWAVLSSLTFAVGVLGLAWFSPVLAMAVVWIVVWNISDHVFFALESLVGLKLAKGRPAGKILGQVTSSRSLGTVMGAGALALLLSLLPKNYSLAFGVAAACSVASAWFFSRIRIDDDKGGQDRRIVYRPQYHLYYVLSVLWGARKQIFLTFSPWLLISRYGASPETIAVLFIIANGSGVIFRQYFGIATDRFGERTVLLVDSVIFLGICIGFAFSEQLWLLYFLYILDSLMFATRIARTTYLGKIAVEKRDIAPTVSLGISIDHVVSMTMPILCGYLWVKMGFQWVFGVAGVVALINGAAVMRMPKT